MKKNSSALRFGAWALSVATFFAASFFGATVRGADKIAAPAASFVNSETEAFVRVDLAAIDLDSIANNCVQIFAKFLQQQGFDDVSVVKTTREFKKTVDSVKDVLRPQLAQIRENFGLQEVFIVGQKIDDFATYRIVVPISSAKQAGVKPLLAFAPFDVQETSKALILAPQVDKTAEYYANFKPGANSRIDEVLQTGSGATVQLYLGDFKLKPFFESESASQKVRDFMQNAPEEIGRAIQSFDQYFVDATGTVELNDLSVRLRFNFTTAKHADEVLVALKKLSDLGGESLEKLISANGEGLNGNQLAEFNVPALTREVARGLLLSALPKRDGVSLVFDGKLDSNPTLGNPAVVGFVIGTVILIPKVLLSRAADRDRNANLNENAADSDGDTINFDAE